MTDGGGGWLGRRNWIPGGQRHWVPGHWVLSPSTQEGTWFPWGWRKSLLAPPAPKRVRQSDMLGVPQGFQSRASLGNTVAMR